VKQAIVEQHRLLESLFAGSQAALAGADTEAMAEALASLRETLEAHFELEDTLYHPPIRTLRPQHAPTLRSIADGHGRFLTELTAILGRVAEGAFADARRCFEELSQEFAAHEAVEEDLMRTIEVEAHGA
jgi:hemerythrin